VVNTFLAPELRQVAWFDWLNWVNGLIAPSFLLIAGWAMGMGAPTGKPIAFWRKTRRLLGVAALGYALHFPWDDLAGHRWEQALRVGSQVDVLQCLALSLFLVLLVQCLAQRAGKEKSHLVFSCLMGLLIAIFVGCAPAVMTWTGGPVPLRAFVNHTTGSLFPLFPWAAFAFAGAALGAGRGLTAGPLLVVAAVIRLLGSVLPREPFFAASPAFFCERLAWVMALAAACQWMAHRWKPGALLFAGRRSLFIYAAHLLIITWLQQAGVPANNWHWAGVLGLFVVVFAATWTAAVGWAKWRDRKKAEIIVTRA
jgi:hypothetical protein